MFSAPQACSHPPPVPCGRCQSVGPALVHSCCDAGSADAYRYPGLTSPARLSSSRWNFSLLISDFSLLTSDFSLLTSHFSLLTSHFPHLPNSLAQGSRCGPGSLQLRRWQHGRVPLPGIHIPARLIAVERSLKDEIICPDHRCAMPAAISEHHSLPAEQYPRNGVPG
ncbi:MAG: hypothetical protein RLZZ436_3688 [Planctomycetota bacterium]